MENAIYYTYVVNHKIYLLCTVHKFSGLTIQWTLDVKLGHG